MEEYIRVLAALLIIIALRGGLALIARRAGLGGAAIQFGQGKNRADKRLKVTETLMIDPKRRLVLVQVDDRETLLLLGPHRDLVLRPAEADFRTSLDEKKGDAA